MVGDPHPNPPGPEPASVPDAPPHGLGGWLIPVAVGLVIHPVRLVRMLMQTYETHVAGGTWDALSPPQAALVATELGGRVGLLVAGLLMLYLYFGRKRVFPGWYLGVSILGLIFAAGDAWATHRLFPGVEVLDTLTRRELLQGVAQCLIWVPYVLLSGRARATFVR
ncbi:MAG: DUF2569 domain-containing protein [Chromatiales bacterium]|jgi:hypothetical protein